MILMIWKLTGKMMEQVGLENQNLKMFHFAQGQENVNFSSTSTECLRNSQMTYTMEVVSQNAS